VVAVDEDFEFLFCALNTTVTTGKFPDDPHILNYPSVCIGDSGASVDITGTMQDRYGVVQTDAEVKGINGAAIITTSNHGKLRTI
jgi:hypothetical protein